MTVLIALAIGAFAGWFLCYAIELQCTMPRNISVCVIGALLFGAVLPGLLSISGFWTAVIGSIIGVVIAFWLYQRATFIPNGYRSEI